MSWPLAVIERLTAALTVWLEEQGRLQAVADRLGIHPQTARYRLNRLRELFGDALDDPDARGLSWRWRYGLALSFVPGRLGCAPRC
jgi:PucR C-terminal helix-turn-helix domain